MAGRVLTGDPERGKGFFSLASQSRELESHRILASKIRGLKSHLSSASYLANHSGKSFGQAFPAHQSWLGTPVETFYLSFKQ